VYYFASVGALTSFAAAFQLPRGDVLWLAARVLLDGAGALFLLYLLIALAALLVGWVMRLRSRQAGLAPELSATDGG
jgi:hypothetical protein